MKDYYQMRKAIAIMLIFILLLPLSSCYTAKIISTTDLPVAGDVRYIVQDGKSKFLIDDPYLTSDSIFGKAKIFNSGFGKKVYLYLKHDSVRLIHDNCNIALDQNEIVRIETRKPNYILNSVIIVVALVALTPIKYFLIGGYDM
jgi:hypothetical protein